jgi:Putative transposase
VARCPRRAAARGSYFHVVFTLPREIAAIALGNKKLLYTILFRAAADTLLQIAADPRHLGATIGFLAILHTWTQTLLFHPHLHCVVPGDGLSADATRWIACRKTFFLPVRVLSPVFRGKFFQQLDHAATSGALRFSGSTAGLADTRAWCAFVRHLRRKNWVVYAKPPFGSPHHVLKYLARYTHRVAISNRRIVSITDRDVTFRYRDRKCGNVVRSIDPRRRRIPPPLPAPRLAEGLRADPPLRPARQPWAHPPPRALPRPARRYRPAAPAPDPDTDSDPDDHAPICPTCGIGRLRHVATIPGAAPHARHRNPRPPPRAL